MKSMKFGTKGNMFNHRGHGGNTLTQCIIFMTFMVKLAVLCVLSVLCGKKRISLWLIYFTLYNMEKILCHDKRTV